MRIAFLGIGLMGLPMATRLIEAGHDLTLWNRSAEKLRPLSSRANIAASPAAAVENAEIVITMLMDGPATRSVLADQGAIEAATSGTLFVDMGSVDPETDRWLANEAATRGCGYLDAPVSGGVAGAEAGTLAILVGGSEDQFETARPVFNAMGRPTLLGPVGAGQVAKLANQLIVATTIGAVAEGFRLAQAGGCDLKELRSALMGGFADSRILELHGQRMVEENYVPGGRSVAQLKDLDNAAALAQATDTALPLSDTVRAAFRDLVENHAGGELDHAAYFHWLELRKS